MHSVQTMETQYHKKLWQGKKVFPTFTVDGNRVQKDFKNFLRPLWWRFKSQIKRKLFQNSFRKKVLSVQYCDLTVKKNFWFVYITVFVFICLITLHSTTNLKVVLSHIVTSGLTPVISEEEKLKLKKAGNLESSKIWHCNTNMVLCHCSNELQK